MDSNPWEVSNLECFQYYCCPECDQKHQSKQIFLQHALEQHPKSIRPIEKMQEITNIKSKTNNKKGHHSCNICGNQFTSAQRWANHLKTVHGDSKPFKCHICNMGFTQVTDVQRHIDRIHNHDRPHKCQFCDSNFSRTYEVSQHMKSAHPEECKQTADDDSAVCEVNKQLENLDLKCQPCGAIFFDVSHLTKHKQIVHKMEKQKFNCHLCKSVFKGKHDLKRHVNSIHHKKKPYMCAKCLVNFSRKSYCKSHLKQVHGEEDMNLILDTSINDDNENEMESKNNNITTTSPIINVENVEEFQKSLWKCLPCKAVFIDEEFWNQHMTSQHDQDSEIICDKCTTTNRTFSSINELKRHNQEIHEKNKFFQCPKCEATFTRKYTCRDHMIKKHKNLETTDIQEISYVESKENELIAEEYEISTSEINDASHATSDENIVMTSAEILEEQISDIQETVISISSNDNVIVVKEATTGISVKPHNNPEDDLKCEKCNFTFKSAFFMHQHFEKFHGITPIVNTSFQGTTSNTICTICSAPFATPDTLQQHIKYVHEKCEKTFLCEKCDHSYKSNSDLQRHIRFVHEGIKDFGCGQCDYFASNQQNLSQHIKSVHEGKRDHKCTQCDSAFHQRSHLKTHILSVHEKIKPFVCHLCGFSTINSTRLQNHIDTRHSEPAQCMFCLATFTSKISLYKHHMSLHKGYPLTIDTLDFEFCNECGIPCLNKMALKKHLYMHKNKEKFAKKQNTSRNTTKLTISNNEVSNKIINQKNNCEICHKNFKTKNSLDQHIRVVHQKIKGFACHLCGKSFGYKKTLDGHISVVHENSGAYPCLNCGKKFAVKSTLDQHIISVHNKEERYRCDLCERGFSRKDYYQIHVRTVHEGSKPYSCDHCGSSYGQMGDMYRHVRKVHGIEPVKVRS